MNMKRLTLSELTEEDAILIDAARDATNLSYSPYSHFRVGAAVLLANGKIVKGANQENASYPVGICAERSTIATAHNLFPDLPIVTLALAAKKRDGEYTQEPVTPCGMCRQAIAECEKRYGKPIRILMASRSEIVVADNIKELLPMTFT